MADHTAHRSVWAFALVWLGQTVSLIGSSLTSFALGVWAYQVTDSATAYALIVLATMGPSAILTMFVGPLVDRWNRRWVLVLSDTGSGLCTLVVYLLLASGQLRLWPILLTTAASSAFSAFQWPAYAASTTQLVPKEHLTRANGLVQIGQALSYIGSPALAGILVTQIDVHGVIIVDFATFAFAVLTLMLVRIPRPAASGKEEAGRGSWWHEFLYGWTYLIARRGLMGMLILFALLNFQMGFVMALFGPMVLAFADADVLGTMTSIGASGMLFGGGLISIWGGPKKRLWGMLGSLLLAGLTIATCGIRPSRVLVTVAAFGFFFCFPIINALSDAIWQSKVAPDVQGRVFATRSTIAMFTMVPAYALAGPLADGVFEPLLATGGPLAESLGRIVGVGQGRGIGLMFIIAGALTVLATAASALFPRLRHLEQELPDAIEADAPADSHEVGTGHPEHLQPRQAPASEVAPS